MNETNSNSNQRTSLSLCITISLVMSLRYYFYNQSESLSSIHISRKPVSVPLEASELYLYYTFIAILVPLGGIFAGLTIGLMSLDTTNLAIIKTSGTPLQKRHASTIAPLMKNQHLLLVTLLLSNTIINESLPVLFHSIQLDGIQAVLMSTGLILLFGEIIPQAVCARHGLAVGAFFAWPVRIMMWIMWIIAYPIAKLLDFVLGHQITLVYRRAELRELVALHGEESGGSLTKDEVSILRAVLEIRDKTVKDIMTSLENVFMLELDSLLDRQRLEAILLAGHSRIPVYRKSRNAIIGVILVKQLIMCDPQTKTALQEFKIRRLPRIKYDTPLFDILHVFEEGGSHMAVVVEEVDSHSHNQSDTSQLPNNLQNSPIIPKLYQTLGIVTLEDVIEELLGHEIIDETDVYIDVGRRIKVASAIKDIEKIILAKNDKKALSFIFSGKYTETTGLLADDDIESQNTRIYKETERILSDDLSRGVDFNNGRDAKSFGDDASHLTPKMRATKRKERSSVNMVDLTLETEEAIVYGTVISCMD